MDEFCPLCRKNGCNNKIKPVQLNFHEAVYLCESETCHWPYGYEEFKFIPRSIDEIGKISPKKSNIKSDAQKTKDGTNVIQISTELSMYTPPVTPSNDGSSTKEISKGTTTSSIHNIFISTTNNHHNNDVSHSEKFMKPPSSGDSYASINNPTSKIAIASPIIAVKNENVPSKVSSIFDIDSSVMLSTNNFEQSQINTLNCCDIRNDDGKNNKLSILNNECSGIRSSTAPSTTLPQIRNVEKTDIHIKELKPKAKIKSIDRRKSQIALTTVSTSDQSDTKLNKKVVIFKEKLSNGITVSEDKLPNQLINRKRPSSDDINSLNIVEQLPKKISRVSNNSELHYKSNNTICKLSDGSLENSTPTIENNCDTSIDGTPGGDESYIVNTLRSNSPAVTSMESKESSIIGNSLDTTSNMVENLNLDSFIDDNFLASCPNTTQEIDDDWLQSFLM